MLVYQVVIELHRSVCWYFAAGFIEVETPTLFRPTPQVMRYCNQLMKCLP